MPNRHREDHQDEAHDDAERARQTQHDDAVNADKTAKSGNPFSLTNILLALGLGASTWMASQIWGTLQDSQKASQTAVSQVQVQMTQMHDEMLHHSYQLDTMQGDISLLKANCMDAAQVDARFRALMQPHANSMKGGEMMMQPRNALAATNWPAVAGEVNLNGLPKD